MSGSDDAPRSFTRYLRNDVRGRRIVVRHRETRAFRDLYHQVLTIRWWWFALGGGAVYLALNAVFGFLYWLDPHGLSGARPGSFADAFDFSVQTLGTIGYGVLSPQSAYANALVAMEAFVSIAVTAMATGVIFARVSRPTARVRFTRNALITTFDGRPVFMFRAANQRNNHVLEAEVHVVLARQTVTAEGRTFRRLEDLRMTRARMPLFALTWTAMHVIDESSPFHGATPESLHAQQTEVIVTLSGDDEAFAQRVHARHSYVAEEIVFDGHFGDVMRVESAHNRYVLDYTDFDLIRRGLPPPAG